MRARIPEDPRKERIVDKMLRNLWNIGYIQMMLPNSCIIHAVRTLSQHPDPFPLSLFRSRLEEAADAAAPSLVLNPLPASPLGLPYLPFSVPTDDFALPGLSSSCTSALSTCCLLIRTSCALGPFLAAPPCVCPQLLPPRSLALTRSATLSTPPSAATNSPLRAEGPRGLGIWKRSRSTSCSATQSPITGTW